MEVKVQDNTWCPFCRKESFTGTPEWMKRLKEIHEREHKRRVK